MNDEIIYPELLRAPEVGELLRVCERTVWRLRSAGLLPQPIRVGRSARWTRESVLQFIRKGGTTNVH